MAKKKRTPTTSPVDVVTEHLQCQVPIVKGLNGYSRSRVMTHFAGDEAKAVKGILQALESEGAKLEDGQFVRTQQHAIRWIVQRLMTADHTPSPGSGS